jgi:methionyl-tRNA formyltransferase
MIPRIVFMGSPEFSSNILNSLVKDYPVVGVVTQPDRPAGRGRKLTAPPAKDLAETLNIPYIQPEKLKNPEALEQIKKWQPDLIIVAAYGQILRTSILDLPKLGCLNVHASLLPRWRGATPIQAAILHGDEFTGISIIKMDEGVDTGPILQKSRISIDPLDNGISLSEKLSEIGGRLLLEVLPKYLENNIQLISQDESAATYAPMIKKEEGLLDFSKSALELERKIRAYYPWPGSYFFLKGLPCRVIKAEIVKSASLRISEHGILDGFPIIGTSMHALMILELQPAGKKRMAGNEFLRGYHEWIN